jgi:hypothetical protein
MCECVRVKAAVLVPCVLTRTKTFVKTFLKAFTFCNNGIVAFHIAALLGMAAELVAIMPTLGRSR